MSWFRESQDHLPLTWWKGHPIYLAAVLALAGLASMIVTAIIGMDAVGPLMLTYPNLVGNLFLWTPATYVFINFPDPWLVLGIFLLWRFGEPVERHLGRRAFVRLVVALVLVLPVMVLLLGLMGWNTGAAGITHLQFGIFLAFATLYPRAQISLIILTMEVWVLAAVLVGVYALAAVATRNWASLLMLIAELAVAYGFIRHEQGQLRWPSLSALIPRPIEAQRQRPMALPQPSKPKRTRRSEPKQPEVDDILDKISREGMHSLTAEERIILDRASRDLQKRKG
ncbi:MAG TPA: rhomboid family intramembrane serine protease [Prosthecobacter sp.]|nr:rhomboid family intramembrane serine protease [Prosthecobacter sp.]